MLLCSWMNKHNLTYKDHLSLWLHHAVLDRNARRSSARQPTLQTWSISWAPCKHLIWQTSLTALLWPPLIWSLFTCSVWPWKRMEWISGVVPNPIICQDTRSLPWHIVNPAHRQRQIQCKHWAKHWTCLTFQHACMQQSLLRCVRQLTRYSGVDVSIDGVVFLPAIASPELLLARPLPHLSIPAFCLIEHGKQKDKCWESPLAVLCESSWCRILKLNYLFGEISRF